jgi:hypothetical protein
MYYLAVFGYTFLIIGVALLIMAPIQAAQNKRRTAEAEAYVTEYRKTYARKRGTTYYINFEFKADGEKQELKNVKWQLPPEESKTYTVCYNPAKPKDAHIKEFRAANPKLFLMIGAVLTVVAVILVAVGTKGGVA